MHNDFYYNLITDPRERGIAIHLEIERFIKTQPCQLAENIQKVVRNSIAAAKSKVPEGKVFIEQWFDTKPKKSCIDWGIKGENYVIIDWKTGTKTENVSYREQAEKYQQIFEGRGQVWIVNVETQQTNKLYSFDSKELVVTCAQCQKLQNIGRFWKSAGEIIQDQERQMGVEITYLFIKERKCFCGNQMRLSASETEYPVGMPGEFEIDDYEGCVNEWG